MKRRSVIFSTQEYLTNVLFSFLIYTTEQTYRPVVAVWFSRETNSKRMNMFFQNALAMEMLILGKEL